MAKPCRRAKTCSASLASAAWRPVVWLFAGLAQWAVRLHFACALAVVAGQAVASHPLARDAEHRLPEAARRLLRKNEELQRALVLPWVLVGAAAAVFWAACAILSAGRHVCRHSKRCLGAIVCCGGCGGCRRRAKAVHTEEVEEKDNGPPKAISSHDSSNVQHLRRRTYPKCI